MSPRSALGALVVAGLTALSMEAEAGVMTPREIYKTVGKAVVLVFATDGSAGAPPCTPASSASAALLSSPQCLLMRYISK